MNILKQVLDQLITFFTRSWVEPKPPEVKVKTSRRPQTKK